MILLPQPPVALGFRCPHFASSNPIKLKPGLPRVPCLVGWFGYVISCSLFCFINQWIDLLFELCVCWVWTHAHHSVWRLKGSRWGVSCFKAGSLDSSPRVSWPVSFSASHSPCEQSARSAEASCRIQICMWILQLQLG